MKFAQFLFLIIAAAVVPVHAGGDHAATGDRGHAHADEGPPTVAVTQWTDRMELFMEYPMMVVGDPGDFIIHLTVLEGFQPVHTGRVTLSFVGLDGRPQSTTADQLLREGIFKPTVTFETPGPREFTLVYAGPSVTDTFVIDDFKVYADEKFLPHIHEEAGDHITFLKEQQWKVPFATATAVVREVRHSVWAIGTVLPSPNAYVEIVSPVEGVVQVDGGRTPALPGTSVSRGDLLAVITPPLQGNGWASARLAFEQAERDYERAQRLKERQAISDRDFEAIENEYRTRRAGFESLRGGGGTEALELHAPIRGRIIEWDLKPGQRVSAGDKLMAIADPQTVWLRANVYERDYHTLGTPVGALVKTGKDGVVIDASQMRVLSTGGALDLESRTVPVLMEVTNETGALRINETVPVELYTSDRSTATAVPVGAIYDDNGMDVVFIQVEGEAFEKRIVRKGPRYENWVSILSGLNVGERVVTEGGYFVKLASTTTEIGHGHAH
jgi:membrane fusion protein, heavy metal efflux system